MLDVCGLDKESEYGLKDPREGWSMHDVCGLDKESEYGIHERGGACPMCVVWTRHRSMV